MYIICRVFVLLFSFILFFSRCILSNDIHEGLPFCGLKTINERYVFISTLDGKVTALNADDGSFVWSLNAGSDPMLSSSIHRLELTSFGQLVRMIPSLAGGLYKFNGENIEAVPVSVDHLLQSSFKYSDDLVISGGKESRSFGVSLQTGQVLYECSMKSCGNNSEATASGDVIVIQRQSQTVRAIEPRSGMEKWNFSVAQHDVKLFSECHHTMVEDSDVTFQVIVPDGLIRAIEKSTNQIIWQYQFDSPIVSGWYMRKGQLVVIDLFSGYEWTTPHNALVAPSIYVGMHNKQLYIQESVVLQHKREELATRYRYNLLTTDIKVPQIPWQPLPASQTSQSLLSSNGITDLETLKTTAISVLYASPYVNGNGFFLFTADEIKGKTTCHQNATPEIEHADEEDEGTPVQIVIVSLWYWWKEVLVISITTALLFNLIFTRRYIMKFKRKQEINEMEITKERKESETLLLPLATHSRQNSENISNEFISRYLTDFEPVQCLGKGGFGVVFEAMNKIDECNYAIKRIILPNKTESRERVMREVRALAKLDHYNIVRYFNAWVETPPLGWQEEYDRYFPVCTSDLISPSHSLQKEKLSPLKFSNPQSICLDVGTPSTEFKPFNPKLLDDNTFPKEQRNDISDSFIIFENSQRKMNDISDSFIVFEASGNGNNNKSQRTIESVITVSSESSSHCDQFKCDDKNSYLNCNKMFLYIQMQLCQTRSLREWLRENVERDYQIILQIFQQIVQAVEYVHLRGLIHRDLKPSNIFFSLDGQIKVGDFGLVTAIPEEEKLTATQLTSNFDKEKHTAQVGTQFYMSPEQLRGQPYNYKVDIYSLGLIFFELLVPFTTQMERGVILGDVRRSVFPEKFMDTYKDEYNLLRLMLSHNPEERPTTFGIRSRDPLRKITSEADLSKMETQWHFELPPKRMGSSKTSLSSSSSSYDDQR